MIRKLLLAVMMCLPLAAAADIQDERNALIQKLIRQGVFQKVEVPGNLPHLWVTPTFNQLDFEKKSNFVSVVYAYYVTKNPSYNLVTVYDSRTGNIIGKYGKEYGGLKLK